MDGDAYNDIYTMKTLPTSTTPQLNPFVESSTSPPWDSPTIATKLSLVEYFSDHEEEASSGVDQDTGMYKLNNQAPEVQHSMSLDSTYPSSALSDFHMPNMQPMFAGDEDWMHIQFPEESPSKTSGIPLGLSDPTATANLILKRTFPSDESGLGEIPLVKKKTRRSKKAAEIDQSSRGQKTKAGQKRTIIQEMLNPDVFRDAKIAEGHSEQMALQPTTWRKKALDEIMQSARIRNLPKTQRRKAHNDRKEFDRACQKLGSHSVIPCADGGEWKDWKFKGMKSTLPSYQIVAAGKMRGIETGTKVPNGGILADQMGLGKTVEACVLIGASLPQEGVFPRATLIVVQSSMFDQWCEELVKHCVMLDKPKKKQHGIFTIRRHRGNPQFLTQNKDSQIKEIESSDIVLTTYHELTASFSKLKFPKGLKDAGNRKAWATGQLEKGENLGILHKCHFLRVCLDEAQVIKNRDSITSLACRMLSADHYWAISGTPVMNGLFEFQPIFDFIKHPLANDGKVFMDKSVDVPTLSAAVEQCSIKRTFADTFMGSALLTLPEIHQEPITLRFSKLESKIYKIVEERCIDYINSYIGEGQLETRKPGMLVLLLRLRQLCAHPMMIKHIIGDILKNEDRKAIVELLGKAARGTGKDAALAKRLRVVIGRALLKPQSIPEPDLLDGVAEPAAQKKPTGPQQCPRCDKTAVAPHITDCLHVYCFDCLEEMQQGAAIQGLDVALCLKCGIAWQTVDVYVDETSGARPTEIDQRIARNRKKVEGDINDWIDEEGHLWISAKARQIKKSIAEMLREDPTTKIIVFVQFLGMIKVLGRVCASKKWGYCSFTGAMTSDAKTKAIKDFRSKPDKSILIASLKSGGVGLNLEAASRVIIVDPWYVWY